MCVADGVEVELTEGEKSALRASADTVRVMRDSESGFLGFRVGWCGAWSLWNGVEGGEG